MKRANYISGPVIVNRAAPSPRLRRRLLEFPSLGTILYLDATYGIAGDMILAALADLGVDLETVVISPLSRALPAFDLRLQHVRERGIAAAHVRVEPRESQPPHRTLAEVEALVEGCGLPTRVAEQARSTFRLLAQAEGKVHGVPPATVHFHEVGALDSLVDVIGCLLAVHSLAVDEVVVSSIALGSGTVETAHGLYPVPAPATLELLRGLPSHPLALGREVSTPTGVALARILADRFGSPPGGCVTAIGHGAGTRRAGAGEPPNLLRVWLTHVEQTAGTGAGTDPTITVIETNLDHLAGEDAGHLIESLLAGGALDAFLLPTIQKKSRPGWLLTVLCTNAMAQALEDHVFQVSGTLGLRRRTTERRALSRATSTVSVAGYPVRVKVAGPPGAATSVRPEFEDLRAVAAATGLSLEEIRVQALVAWHQNRPLASRVSGSSTDTGSGAAGERGTESRRRASQEDRGETSE